MTPTPSIAGYETARLAKGCFFETSTVYCARRAVGDRRPDVLGR
jgi:hypothetical protein